MAEFSVNLTNAILLCAGKAEPRYVRGSRTEIMTDRDTGAKLYRVPMVLIQPSAKPQLIEVTVPDGVGLTVSAPLSAENLRANSYEFDGRSGISWRADSAEVIGGPSVDENGAPTAPISGRGPAKQAS
ncbi:hypothetical protein [Cryptosporangium phraense]|uniref:DUF961 domain-containing protein n=1 Tax=Cryptosporangium phraense TaxID=2593070 RepID=A0A545AEH0_9ACTN|nr:hypothetical protein [Cryptosporangium phraense]TQS39709.1 hypothetical protein FL583_38725 [Cryptosporangium phraense]